MTLEKLLENMSAKGAQFSDVDLSKDQTSFKKSEPWQTLIINKLLGKEVNRVDIKELKNGKWSITVDDKPAEIFNFENLLKRCVKLVTGGK